MCRMLIAASSVNTTAIADLTGAGSSHKLDVGLWVSGFLFSRSTQTRVLPIERISGAWRRGGTDDIPLQTLRLSYSQRNSQHIGPA